MSPCWTGDRLPPLRWWQVVARLRRWWRFRALSRLRRIEFPIIKHAHPTLSVDEMLESE